MSSDRRLQLLKGVLNEKHPLHIFDHSGLIWNNIWRRVDEWYDEHIDSESVAFMPETINPYFPRWTFPPPTGLNVNMMPIKYYDLQNSLPAELTGYKNMIRECYVPYADLDDCNRSWIYNQGKIVYLTIQETLVPVGQCQRRRGLHIEKPLAIHKGGRTLHRPDPYDRNTLYAVLAWGGGTWHSSLNHEMAMDGIYMADNVSDTCQIYPALIDHPETFVDRHGGLEHARAHLGDPVKLEKDRLYWLTDRTPHECLPTLAPEGDVNATQVNRSFFRLVVGGIDVWYSKHCTPNPLGILPDCPISDEDKFQ